MYLIFSIKTDPHTFRIDICARIDRLDLYRCVIGTQCIDRIRQSVAGSRGRIAPLSEPLQDKVRKWHAAVIDTQFQTIRRSYRQDQQDLPHFAVGLVDGCHRIFHQIIDDAKQLRLADSDVAYICINHFRNHHLKGNLLLPALTELIPQQCI